MHSIAAFHGSIRGGGETCRLVPASNDLGKKKRRSRKVKRGLPPLSVTLINLKHDGRRRDVNGFSFLRLEKEEWGKRKL